MKNVSIKNELIVFIALVLVILASRLVTHAWNFTAVGGVAIFAGAFFTRKWLSFLVLFTGLFISDAIIGFHNQMAGVYIAFVVMMGLGYTLSVQSTRARTLATSFVAALAFFFISNFAVWMEGVLYPMTMNGLVQSYVMGLPFLRNQLIADVLSAFVLFEVARSEAAAAVAVRLKL